MNIVRTDDPHKEAARRLELTLRHDDEQAVLLMLSGGSALSVLEDISADVLGEHVTISVVDERYSMDPSVNNFCQLEGTTFFDRCLEKGVTVIGTRIHKGQSLPGAAMEFDGHVRKWREVFPQGRVVALLGMGEDGHTAGVLPFPDNSKLFADLFLDKEWVASFDATLRGKEAATNEHSLRFTTTLTFLREQVEHAVVFAVGEKKQKALMMVQESSEDLHGVPARIFHHMQRVEIVTDNK